MAKVWGDPGTYLVMWRCGDDVCDCHRVQIETRDYLTSFLLNCEDVSEFHSQPDENDWKEMKMAWDKAILEKKPDFVQKVDWLYQD